MFYLMAMRRSEDKHAVMASSVNITMDVNDAHKKLAHMSE